MSTITNRPYERSHLVGPRRIAWSRLNRPLRRHIITAVLGLSAALLTAGSISRAQSTARIFGATTTVAVARHELAPGTELADGDLEMRSLPIAMIPADPASEPLGRVAKAAIMPGEVILEARLAPDGVHGPVALLGRDRVAIAIPLDGPTPKLQPGDVVDLLGSDSPGILVRGAEVIETTDEAVTMALGREQSVLVAGALMRGPVLIALTGPG